MMSTDSVRAVPSRTRSMLATARSESEAETNLEIGLRNRRVRGIPQTEVGHFPHGDANERLSRVCAS